MILGWISRDAASYSDVKAEQGVLDHKWWCMWTLSLDLGGEGECVVNIGLRGSSEITI